MDIEYLAAKALWVRQQVVRMAYRANSGHLSTAFSQAELLVALYHGGILRVDPKNPKWPGRDRFILSKGQGGLGLYPVLADMGYFPQIDLDNFAGRGSLLGVHCEWHIPGVEIITGSLGHGLPVATGMAVAARDRGEDHLVVCMVGDGELYEGSNWEAMFTAAHQRLGHLMVIVDNNKQATIGHLEGNDGTADGPSQYSLWAKFEEFGFETRTIDGHNLNRIMKIFDQTKPHNRELEQSPMCFIANTVKGKGCRIMESGQFWPNHYRLPYGDDLLSLLADLNIDADELKTAAGGRDLGY